MQRITGLLLLLIFSACSSKNDKSGGKQKPGPALVDVLIADTMPMNTTLDVNGNILSYESVEIHPEINGRLTALNMNDGASVTEGQVLARINDADLQAQLNKLNAQLALAVTTEARQAQLLKINAINQADYDVALNNLSNIKADITFVHAQIDKTIIKAPFSGILGLRNVSPGAYVTPQTILTTLSQNNLLKLDFSAPQRYSNLLTKGKLVQIFSEDRSDSSTASILATESAVNTANGNIRVRATVTDNHFYPGSFVVVKIPQSALSSVIMVPTNAIIPEATAKKLVIVKNGKGQMVNVKTGIRTASAVEITSGISVGDSVVVNGILFVKPGSEVKVSKVLKQEELLKP